jgi:hypothetical protein
VFDCPELMAHLRNDILLQRKGRGTSRAPRDGFQSAFYQMTYQDRKSRFTSASRQTIRNRHDGGAAGIEPASTSPLIGLYSTEKLFEYYVSACPSDLQEQGLFDIVYRKYASASVLQMAVIAKIADDVFAAKQQRQRSRQPKSTKCSTHVVSV